MNIGLLGGTFDPIHNGHLAIAEEAMSRLELDEVIFIPAALTPLKEANDILAAAHRLKMVELAIAGNPRFRLSDIELKRPGISYTVDTVSEMRKRYESGVELYFIIGYDSLTSLPRWREPGRIISACRLVAVPRPGCRTPDLDALEKEIPGLSARVTILDGPHVDISSTDIRERVSRGQPVTDRVPGQVSIYMKEKGLYLSE